MSPRFLAKKGSKSQSIWPPPAPYESGDSHLLPANLRPARPDLPSREPRSPGSPGQKSEKQEGAASPPCITIPDDESEARDGDRQGGCIEN